MQRFSFRARGLTSIPRSYCPRATVPSRLTSQHARRTYTSSSPKEAEEASAQSGGSRSKDAAEQAEGSEQKLGRTGGGEPLKSSQNAPPQPKIWNASVPGEGSNKLTKEQQEEVDRHNAEFEKKHDRASQASDDKVHKSFWTGTGGRDRDP